jgi:hypothetical protein
MDGWRRTGSDDDFPIRQVFSVGLGFTVGLAGPGIP